VLGPLIPPSIAFVIWGIVAEQSIGKLFLSGIVPGLAIAAGLLVVCYVHAKRNSVPKQEKARWPEVREASRAAMGTARRLSCSAASMAASSRRPRPPA
jgi:C4-dicarboxylate transporter DctM subunit